MPERGHQTLIFAWETKFGALDGRKGSEHKCVGFVEISRIFPMQDVFLYKAQPLTDVAIDLFL